MSGGPCPGIGIGLALIGGACVIGVGTVICGGGYAVYSGASNFLEKSTYNRPGPSKIEIIINDINGDGKNETLLEYEGTKYIINENNYGKLSFKEYEIGPLKVDYFR